MPEGRIFHAAMIIALLYGAFTFSRQSATAPAPPPEQQSQQPGRAAAPAGSISGHVYRADSGAPLAGAIVSLWLVPSPGAGNPFPNGPPLRQAARSGPDGAYKFSVEPDVYGLKVERNGFVDGYYPNISVAAGHSITDVEVRLRLAGTISGSVHDQNGQPIRRIPVMPLCQPPSPARNATITNERGNFRISGLVPANCYVTVGQLRAGPDSRLNFYAVWYPNADSQDTAQSIQVKPGEETANIHFKVLLTPSGVVEPGAAGDEKTPQARPPTPPNAASGSISGSVHDQDNQPLEGVFIRVSCKLPQGGRGDPTSGGHSTDDQGNFEVFGLPPGDCYVGALPEGSMALAGYQGAYYPNADTLDNAKLVPVQPGAETRDIRITVAYSPIFSVSVKIMEDGNGGQGNRYFISASPVDRGARTLGAAGWRPILTGPDGVGVLRGICAGKYNILVNLARATYGPNGQLRGWAHGNTWVGSAIVQVVDSDVGVEIPISRPPTGER